MTNLEAPDETVDGVRVSLAIKSQAHGKSPILLTGAALAYRAAFGLNCSTPGGWGRG